MSREVSSYLGQVMAIIFFGIVGSTFAQSTNNDLSDGQGGRYRLIPVNNGTFSIPYVIDTQTGRVWREVIDSEHNAFLFVSVNYRNLDGELSKVPNETATSVFFKDKSPAPLNGDTPNTNVAKDVSVLFERIKAKAAKLETLNDDLQLAIKEAALWQRELERVQSGLPIRPLVRWDANGNAVYGSEVQPSDKLEAEIKQSIDTCLKIKEQKEQLIKQLQDKTP